MDKLLQKIPLYFFIISAFLIFIQIIILLLNQNSDLSQDSLFVRLFDLNKEKNIPAVFSSFGLFTAGVLLFLIAYYDSNLKRSFWTTLGFIFLLLAYDELFAFHENLIKPVREYLNVTGYLYFAWVIPYGIIVVLLLLAFYRFLNKLPVKTKRLIIASGAIYVLGALGFELLGGKQYVSDGEVQTFIFKLLYTIEESMEMLGIVLFLYTLTDYFKRLTSWINKNNLKADRILVNTIGEQNDSRRTGTD